MSFGFPCQVTATAGRPGKDRGGAKGTGLLSSGGSKLVSMKRRAKRGRRSWKATMTRTRGLLISIS